MSPSSPTGGGVHQGGPARWPSAGKWRRGVAGMWRQPGGRFELPEAPNMERFILLQRGALEAAIRKSRELTGKHDTGTGGAAPFGLNRQYRSVLEARIDYWRRAALAPIARYEKGGAYTTSQAGEAHYEPRWADIQRDMRKLYGALAASIYGAMDEYLGGQALDALGEWPYKTGLSKALLHVEIAPGQSGDEIMRASLVAGAGYSGYIKQGGFRVVRSTYTDKKGTERVRRKHVYSDNERLPSWKARYLVQMADGRWRFDAEAYDRRKAAGGKLEMEDDYTPAKGKPYRDLMTKPANRTVKSIGREATAESVRGST